MSGTDTTIKTRDAGGTERESEEREHPDDVDQLTCPECGATGVRDETNGETVCTECGVVLEDDLVDRGPEWRAFNAGERDKKSRVGAPTTGMLHDKGLSSVIDWKDQDAHGAALSSRKRQEMQRLRTWDERFRAQSAQDRNLKQALGEISRMASALNLPDNVQETASVIYRRALEEDLLPGRSIEAMATAALYGAARKANVPRSLDEFAPVSRVPRKEYARAYRYMNEELELAIKPADPASYLPRFCSELEAPAGVRNRARELLSAAERSAILSGKNPVGLAAAAIYAAGLLCDEKLTQNEIADVADVSTVTIRERYPELLDAGATNPAQPAD